MNVNELVQELIKFVTDNGIQIAICLYIIGLVIKKTERIPDSLIPVILLILGIAGSVAMGVEPTVGDSVMQGIYACGLAVFGNQFLKQGKEFHQYMINDEIK